MATPFEERSPSSSLNFKVNACRVKQAFVKAISFTLATPMSLTTQQHPDHIYSHHRYDRDPKISFIKIHEEYANVQWGPHFAANHVVRFIRYLSKQNITQPCDQMELFVLSIAPSIDWLESCKHKSIPSLPMLTTHFLLHEGPSFQPHEDISQMLDMVPREEEVLNMVLWLRKSLLLIHTSMMVLKERLMNWKACPLRIMRKISTLRALRHCKNV